MGNARSYKVQRKLGVLVTSTNRRLKARGRGGGELSSPGEGKKEEIVLIHGRGRWGFSGDQIGGGGRAELNYKGRRDLSGMKGRGGGGGC